MWYIEGCYLKNVNLYSNYLLKIDFEKIFFLDLYYHIYSQITLQNLIFTDLIIFLTFKKFIFLIFINWTYWF